MKSFLEELAEKIFRENRRTLESVKVIFPNRRAVLFFRKHLSSLLDRPSFSPSLVTIEDFIGGFSPLRVPEKLQLIHKLYHVYRKVHSGKDENPETFDQFFFWGDMLLRDFDEADRYLVKTDQLFRDLSHQKELDSGFDFLTDEQRDFLKQFWLNFEGKDSITQRRFLDTWRKLPEVYQAYRTALVESGMAYTGLVHRTVAENIGDLSQADAFSGRVVFAGFNALTRAEEAVITHYVEEKSASVYWDLDDYYFNNQTQEGGRFFREYSRHPVLGQTFANEIPSNFKKEKKVSLYAAALPVGQAKIMAQVLHSQIREEGLRPEETLIVLPDEKLLAPVLHGVAGDVEKLNVTMGFPLASTPVYNLIELLVELQLSRKDDHFNHRPVVALLGHPYVVAASPSVAHAKRKEILLRNWVNIPASFLATEVAMHRIIFGFGNVVGKAWLKEVLSYLRAVIVETGTLPGITDFDKEYCFHFVKILNRMDEVFNEPDGEQIEDLASRRQELKSFMRLFRQITRAEKIPFSGEPLSGLQIMGVLETRNLDFKNIFVLSLNEGAFPSYSGKGSYIPFNIRKAYGMPTVDQQDSIYAYLFYRMLQRAENIFLFYNSETDELGQGEMSRYLQQLLYESALPHDKHVLHNDLQPMASGTLVVPKDERVFQALQKYCEGAPEQKKLSPTALNEYLECRLKFYFRYVAKIREPKEVEEDLDARVLGNFLHTIMELFYLDVIERKGVFTIEKKDFDNYEGTISDLIDKAFILNYKLDPEKNVIYEGQRLVVREMVSRFVNRIIEVDRSYAPFRIEALERRDIDFRANLGNAVVLVSGSIDRADSKDNVIRVIDYKTGKDETSFSDVQSLFNREGKRNKAAFQTFIYTLLYHQSLSELRTSYRIVPGLMNRKNLFNEDFRFGLQQGGEFLEDATPLLPEFEEKLKGLLFEMFDPQVPFDQTAEIEICRLCSYNKICYR